MVNKKIVGKEDPGKFFGYPRLIPVDFKRTGSGIGPTASPGDPGILKIYSLLFSCKFLTQNTYNNLLYPQLHRYFLNITRQSSGCTCSECTF